jgi:aminoglycoside/choline kinase family phosphotransferase
MIELDENLAQDFLLKHNYKDCQIKKIAGDASFRSYYRILCKQENFILMFAPPKFEDTKPFIQIAEFLVKNSFSAPKILATDEENGFLLLEDLGDNTYGRVLVKDSGLELELYEKATDVLLELRKIKNLPKINSYNNATLFMEIMFLVDWYLPLTKKPMSLKEKSEFKHLWFQLFDLLDKENQILVLRDYHADNLMVLDDHKVGLLDFQDALIGSTAYDLVSLLEDARRDVNQETRDKILEYYIKKSGIDEKQFLIDYKILSLQRNIKILGIFARLAMRDNKKHYLTLMPRVLDLVKNRAFSNDPIFFEMGNFLKKFL